MKKVKGPYRKIAGTGVSEELYVTWNEDHETWRVELYPGESRKLYIGAYRTIKDARIARNAALEAVELLHDQS